MTENNGNWRYERAMPRTRDDASANWHTRLMTGCSLRAFRPLWGRSANWPYGYGTQQEHSYAESKTVWSPICSHPLLGRANHGTKDADEGAAPASYPPPQIAYAQFRLFGQRRVCGRTHSHCCSRKRQYPRTYTISVNSFMLTSTDSRQVSCLCSTPPRRRAVQRRGLRLGWRAR